MGSEGIADDIVDSGKDYLGIHQGLITGDFGQARDSATRLGVRVGKRVRLIDEEKEPLPEPNVPGEPTLANATTEALNSARRDMRRRLASKTLFSGGGGVLDANPSASSVLLGM